MKFKHLLLLNVVGALSVSAMAGSPQFTFDRYIQKAYIFNEFIPRMNSAVADAQGGVYHSENLVEWSIYYIPDPLANPNSEGWSEEAFDGSSLTPGFSLGNGGFFGMTIDSNGTVFASGSTEARTAAVKISRDGSTINSTELTMPTNYKTGASYIRLGGCAAVGPNKFVASGYQNGSLHFFSVSDSTAFLDGVVPGPSDFSGRAPDVYFVDGKIYMTQVSTDASPRSGGLWLWDSDGTPAGTGNPAQVTGMSSASDGTNSRYSSIAYSAANKAFAIPYPSGSSNRGWRLFDATQTGSTRTPYLTLNGGEAGGPGAIGTGDAALGAVFFNKGEDEYLMVSTEDGARRFLIYKIVPGSSVSDWSMY